MYPPIRHFGTGTGRYSKAKVEGKSTADNNILNLPKINGEVDIESSPKEFIKKHQCRHTKCVKE